MYQREWERERERGRIRKRQKNSLSFLIFFLSFFFFLCVYDPRIGCGALKNPAVPSLHLLYLSLPSVILLTSCNRLFCCASFCFWLSLLSLSSKSFVCLLLLRFLFHLFHTVVNLFISSRVPMQFQLCLRMYGKTWGKNRETQCVDKKGKKKKKKVKQMM